MSASPYLTTMTPMKSMPMAAVMFKKRENPLLPGSSASRCPEAVSREMRPISMRTSLRLR